MPQILFVCTGNHCRSPLAEAWFRELSSRAGVTLEVGSAGVNALAGVGANPLAVEVLAERGIDFAAFRGRQLTRELADESELIVVMSQVHATAICETWPELQPRVITLMSLLDRDDDVTDPLGGGMDDFRACLESIQPPLEALLQRFTVPKES